MTPDVVIASLDDRLAEIGQTITLQRVTFPDGVRTVVSVDCLAITRGYRPEELVGGISQQDSFVILSLSEITAAGWPGEQPQTTLDPRVPLKNDMVIIDGRIRAIEAVNQVSIGNTIVRIEMQVRG